MQNALGDCRTLCHDENGKCGYIQWQYIDILNDVQEDFGFSIAKKLEKKHSLWTKHKMNVKVTAQTLSSSIASAIDFLCDNVNLPEFHTSEGTSDFIKKIDLLFNLLNSRNPFAQGNKQPVTKKNICLIGVPNVRN